MRRIAYYADRDSLLSPQKGETVFNGSQKLTEDMICVEFSRLTYKRFETGSDQEAEIERALSSIGFDEVGFSSKNEARVLGADSQAVLAKNNKDGIVIIAFRGTQSDCPSDVLSDTDIRKVPWGGNGGVHNGFKLAFELVKSDLETWFDHIRDDCRVIFTGHSLGAAMATLAASCFNSRTARLVTFGSPRLGDGKFVAQMTADRLEVARYVNCCDIVTRIPPEFLDFQHLGTPKYINKDGEIPDVITDENILSDQSSAREQYWKNYAWRSGTNAFRDLSDHAPINYVTPLFKIPV